MADKGKWALASPSANPLADREMKSKRQKVKGNEEEKARESISDKIPKSSIVQILLLIARMSICESDRRHIFVCLSEAACRRAPG